MRKNSKTIICCLSIALVFLIFLYAYNRYVKREYFTINDITLIASSTASNTLIVTPSTTTPSISTFTVNYGDGTTPISSTTATSHVYSNIGSFAGNIAITYSDSTTGNIPFAITVTANGITNISITPPPTSSATSPTTVSASTTGTIVPWYSKLYHHGSNYTSKKPTSTKTSSTKSTTTGTHKR